MERMTQFTASGLYREGFSTRRISDLATQGELRRLRQGGYSDSPLGTPVEVHRQLIEVTAPYLGPRTVLSHTSAAVLHGLPVPDDILFRVTATRFRTTRGGGNSRKKLRIFAAALAPEDIVEIGSLPVTSLSRTAADLARVLDQSDAVVLLDAALHDPRGGELSGMREQIADHIGIGRSRNNTFAAIQRLGLADGRADSPLETRIRLVFHRNGIDKPVLQWQIYDESGTFVARTDFAWPELGVVGEADGLVKYLKHLRPGETPADAVVREKQREDRIRKRGLLVGRWINGDLERPTQICSELRHLFEMGRPYAA